MDSTHSNIRVPNLGTNKSSYKYAGSWAEGYGEEYVWKEKDRQNRKQGVEKNDTCN